MKNKNNKNDKNDNKNNNKSDKNIQTIMKTNNNININHSELDINKDVNKDVNQPEGGVVVFDTSVLITPPPTPSITTSSTSLSPSFSLMTHRR